MNMDLKNQILVALGLDSKEEEISLSFQAKLEDGTIIVSEADELAEGVDISVLAEDGSVLPLPAGEYRTEDALLVVVEEEGIVASVSQEEAPAEDEVSEEVVEEEEEVAMEEVEEEVLEEEVVEEAPVEEAPVVATPKSITTTTTEKVEFNKDEFLAEINDSIVALKSEIETLKTENADLTAKLSESAVEPLNLNKHSNDYNPLKSTNKYLTKFNNLNK
jgi:hypothetical protein